MIFLHIVAAWLLADAMSGAVHWTMDKRLQADGLFPGIAADNELHHTSPRSIIRFSLWQNISTSWPALPISVALFLAGAPTFLWLSFAFLLFGNVVHRWAHARQEECPRLVLWLQRRGVFQSPSHHARHHYFRGSPCTRAEAMGRYCVMSNYVNAYLEWRAR